jgi:iron complex outermembrane recepter protein
MVHAGRVASRKKQSGMSESKMQNLATRSILVSGVECDVPAPSSVPEIQLHRGLASGLGAVGLGAAGAVGPGAVGPGAVGPGAVGPGAVGPGAVGLGARRRHSSWLRFAQRSVLSLRGGVTLMLLASSALAQNPAPAAPAPAPAPEEAPAPEAAPTDEPQPELSPQPGATEGDPAARDAADLAALQPEAAGPVEAREAEGEAEVVVTVDRRTKSLQDYSGVASAFSEKKLASVGITNVRDLSAQVPGLKIANQEGNTEIFIRGVGSDNNTELGDPAVALHIDGVYIPRPRGLGTAFFDIERVEVSSGPQGTLRGRNALAGTINIVTAQPKLGEFAANAEGTFGNYALRRYTGMVNIPVGDKLAFRFAAMSEVHDPYYENGSPIYDIRAPEDADNYALRATLKYQPTERFTATVAYDLTAERGVGYVGSNFQGAITHTNPDGTPAPIDPNDVDHPRTIYMHGMQPHAELKHQGVRADLTFDTGPVILNALGSFRDLDYTQNTGSNNGVVYPGFDYAAAAGDLDGFGSSYWHTKSQSFVGELRAYSPDSARLRWTVGAFMFDETQDAFLGQASDPHAGYGGGEFNMPGVKGSSFAGYADATFDVNESFRVLGGVRVTREHKDRKNGLWALWNNLPLSSAGSTEPGGGDGFGRFGTEGFKYKGFDRPTYTRGNTTTDRVNFFLDGIDSFGARDTLPIALCKDPPAAAMGQVQGPRIAKENGNFRCTAGIRPEILNGTLPGWTGFSNFYQYVPQNNEVNNTFFDWRAGVEYDLSKDNLAYATVSTGHKAGGFNDTQDFGLVKLYNTDYKPESMTAFELGSKNTFLERKLRLNGSAFAYLYQDLVFQTIVSVGEDPDPNDPNVGPPASAVRQNAPATTTALGLDLDVAYALPAGLEVEVHALLMDSKFGDGTVVNDSRIGFGDNSLVDLGGNYLPRAPVFTLNYALSQLIFSDVGSFNWIIQAQTVGKQYLSVFNGDGTRLLPLVPSTPERPNPQTANYTALLANPARLTDVVDTYTRIDVGVGWTHPDGRLAINGYVNNLTDISYATSINANPGNNQRFFNNPRTLGVRVKIDW